MNPDDITREAYAQARLGALGEPDAYEHRVKAIELAITHHADAHAKWPASERDITETADRFLAWLEGR